MSPFAPAHYNKAWFAVLLAFLLVGLASGMAFYYYRTKLRVPNSRTLEIETLASTGTKPEPPSDHLKHEGQQRPRPHL